MIPECDWLLIAALHAAGKSNDEISFETPYLENEIGSLLKRLKRKPNEEKKRRGPYKQRQGRYSY